MRSTTASFWLLLKLLKHDIIISKVISTKSLFLRITTINDISSIWKVWAPDRSIKLKSCLNIIFKSIINKTKQMKLLMLYPDILNGMLKKNTLLGPKTPRFYTICSISWPEFLVFQLTIFPLSIKSSFMKYQFYHSYASSRTLFKASYPTKIFMLPVLEL